MKEKLYISSTAIYCVARSPQTTAVASEPVYLQSGACDCLPLHRSAALISDPLFEAGYSCYPLQNALVRSTAVSIIASSSTP